MPESDPAHARAPHDASEPSPVESTKPGERARMEEITANVRKHVADVQAALAELTAACADFAKRKEPP